MEEDEDAVMRDPGSLSRILPTSGTTSSILVDRGLEQDVSTGVLPSNTATSHGTRDGIQPATLFGMPKLPSSLLSPPPKPSSNSNGNSISSTEIQGLTKSIEDEGLHMIKSSEESDSIMEENSDFSVDDAATSVGLPVASLATGLCYDIRMRYHCEVRPAAEVHPEDPRRIYYIYKEICRAGLVEDPDIIATPRPLAPVPLQRINVRNATKEEVELVHTDEHYQFVSDTQSKSKFQLIILI